MKPNGKPATHPLEAQLRAERPLLAPGPQFTAGVLNALPSSRATPVPSRPSRLWIPALAFGSAALALVAVLVSNFSERTPGPNPQVSAQAIEPVREPEASRLIFPKLTSAEIEGLTMKIDEPLDREMKNVMTDTRHAIQFVAANFLPENK